MTLITPDSDQLVGYRLIRRLGAGSRADVYLGVPHAGGEGAALKVFREHVSADSIGTELGALRRSASPHIVRLDDIATGPDGRPVAILRRLPRSSLAALIAERETVELGEAVTILAPIVAAVGELHRAGVVHSAIAAGSVLFGARGEPVLAGFGRAELLPRGLSVAALDAEPAVIAERQRLVRFVVGGLQRARAGEATLAIDDLVRWSTEPRTTDRFEFLDELEQRLFDLAQPIPVAFGVIPSPPRVPNRLGEPALTDSARTSVTSGPLPTRRERRIAETVEATFQRSPRSVVASWVRAGARSVRKPVWIVLGLVLTLLVLACVLVPGAESARPATPTSVPLTSVPPPSSHPTGSPAPGLAPSNSAGSGPRASVEPAPDRALSGLLQRRTSCMRNLSVGCLTEVDQTGSAALAADSAAIQRVRAGGELDPMTDRFAGSDATSERVSISERIGDAAIVSVTTGSAEAKPALVLIIETKAGWRIRSYLDSASVTR